MCGICGVLCFNRKVDEATLKTMVHSMHHRGPDNESGKIYTHGDVSCALGHARLSIIDLSPNANQPMEFGNLSIVFNGEIYNFKQLKTILEEKGHRFLLNSDTEVILHAFNEWGTDCVDKFIGMFSFAIYDGEKQMLHLFRDRAGVKPLYYYLKDDILIFASELKAIVKSPYFQKRINIDSVSLYFKFGYIPEPNCIYENTYKLTAGSLGSYNIKRRNWNIVQYWNVFDFYDKEKLLISYEDAKDHLEELLISACDYRMVSDVPVGLFLSGGYDSSGIAALLQASRSEKLKTFTIGFEDVSSEIPTARKVSQILGTDHTEYVCTSKEAQDIIPDLPYYYDEPFADTSSIPTILVSRIARQSVKVALSADAGDEIFAGYTSYQQINTYSKRVSMIPNSTFLSKSARQMSNMVKNDKIASLLSFLSDILVKSKTERQTILQERVRSWSNIKYNRLLSFDYPYLYDKLCSMPCSDPVLLMQLIDYICYLPSDILLKVDRASMSTSLESRCPLTDHRLVEFVTQLPTSYKLDNYSTKKIFKDIVHKYIPKEVMERPKSGFGIPGLLNNWLRTDLSYLISEYITEKELENVGIYNIAKVLEYKRQFLQGKYIFNEPSIWLILQFQMWYKMWN